MISQHIKLLILFFLFNILAYANTNKANYKANLKTGDLIFQEACMGELNNAIKKSTSGYENHKFTHVGIVYINDNDIYVVEATPPQVAITPIRDYLYPEKEAKCPPVSIVGRLKPNFRHLIPAAIDTAMTLIGKQYDDAYDIKNDKYYCSELIYEIFRKANNGKEIFQLTNMTFKNSDTGEFPNEWVQHFSKLNIPIPEGKPGNNPGDMSRSEMIEILDIDLSK